MTSQQEYPLTPIVGVGAVVLQQDCVLLVRRGKAPLAGQWSLPGGAVELGETLEQAVVREVAEETGLVVVPLQVLKTFDHIDRDADGQVRFHYVLVDFLCGIELAGASGIESQLNNALQAASDVSDARWVPLQGLRTQQEFLLTERTQDMIATGWDALKQKMLRSAEG